jgi:hypothetical protein
MSNHNFPVLKEHTTKLKKLPVHEGIMCVEKFNLFHS